MILNVIRAWKCEFQIVTPILYHVSVLSLHTSEEENALLCL